MRGWTAEREEGEETTEEEPGAVGWGGSASISGSQRGEWSLTPVPSFFSYPCPYDVQLRPGAHASVRDIGPLVHSVLKWMHATVVHPHSSGSPGLSDSSSDEAHAWCAVVVHPTAFASFELVLSFTALQDPPVYTVEVCKTDGDNLVLVVFHKLLTQVLHAPKPQQAALDLLSRPFDPACLGWGPLPLPASFAAADPGLEAAADSLRRMLASPTTASVAALAAMVDTNVRLGEVCVVVDDLRHQLMLAACPRLKSAQGWSWSHCAHGARAVHAVLAAAKSMGTFRQDERLAKVWEQSIGGALITDSITNSKTDSKTDSMHDKAWHTIWQLQLEKARTCVV